MGGLKQKEIFILLGVSIGTMLLTSSFLALIIVLIGSVLVMVYFQSEQDLKEQQEIQLRAQELEREKQPQEAEQQKQRQAELENQNYILEYGITQRPEGGFRVAIKEEVRAAKKAQGEL